MKFETNLWLVVLSDVNLGFIETASFLNEEDAVHQILSLRVTDTEIIKLYKVDLFSQELQEVTDVQLGIDFRQNKEYTT